MTLDNRVFVFLQEKLVNFFKLSVTFVNKRHAAEQTCKRNIRIEEEDDGSMNSFFRPGSYLRRSKSIPTAKDTNSLTIQAVRIV